MILFPFLAMAICGAIIFLVIKLVQLATPNYLAELSRIGGQFVNDLAVRKPTLEWPIPNTLTGRFGGSDIVLWQHDGGKGAPARMGICRKTSSGASQTKSVQLIAFETSCQPFESTCYGAKIRSR